VGKQGRGDKCKGAAGRESAQGDVRRLVLVRVAKHIFRGVLGVVDRRGERVLWCHTVLDVEDYVVGVRGNEPAETVVSTMILESKPTAIEIDQHGMRLLPALPASPPGL
jgi:hypothetical protein